MICSFTFNSLFIRLWTSLPSLYSLKDPTFDTSVLKALDICNWLRKIKIEKCSNQERWSMIQNKKDIR